MNNIHHCRKICSAFMAFWVWTAAAELQKKSFAFYLRATLNLVLGWLQCGFALDSGYAKYCKSSCQEPWSNTSNVGLAAMENLEPLQTLGGGRHQDGISCPVVGAKTKRLQNLQSHSKIRLATKHGDFSRFLRSVSALSRFIVCTDSFCPNCQATGEFSSMPCECLSVFHACHLLWTACYMNNFA